MLLSPCNTEPD